MEEHGALSPCSSVFIRALRFFYRVRPSLSVAAGSSCGVLPCLSVADGFFLPCSSVFIRGRRVFLPCSSVFIRGRRFFFLCSSVFIHCRRVLFTVFVRVYPWPTDSFYRVRPCLS